MSLLLGIVNLRLFLVFFSAMLFYFLNIFFFDFLFSLEVLISLFMLMSIGFTNRSTGDKCLKLQGICFSLPVFVCVERLTAVIIFIVELKKFQYILVSRGWSQRRKR